ncbi:hypothetical protein CCACVL1_17774 [Corchorus capsularis]|uniref:F-box domain-containing protein n=1 Tax=Corchorus capsularis TaxID=210143 RepID=A0A1R3HPW5_COCAP|nr:hypothetical protein CCACVL1_17774 [Corchorus capsularis]
MTEKKTEKNYRAKLDPRNIASDLELDPKDYISGLPDSILYHIISKLPFEFAVQTCRLSTQWKDVWQKALLEMVEDPSLEDIDITLTNFLEQLSEFNRPTQNCGFKFNFGRGRFFFVAITPNNKLVFDSSFVGEQKLSEPFDLLLPLNLPKPHPDNKQHFPEHIKVKSLHLKSVSSLICKTLSSFLSKKKLPFLESLTIEKCNGLQSLEINEACRLSTLIVLDCPKLEFLSIRHNLFLDTFRYRGRYVSFQYLYGAIRVRDVMLDFRHGSIYNNNYWTSSSSRGYTNCHVKELWWIDCSIEGNQVKFLLRFLKECPFLERLYVTIDPNCYPDSCKLTDRFSRRFTNENGKCFHAAKQTLSHLKLVKLEGFPNEKEEIKFVRKLIPLSEETPEIIAKSPDGTCLRQLVKVARPEKNGKNPYSNRFKVLKHNAFTDHSHMNFLFDLKLKLDRKDYISGLPNDIVYHIISKLPFEVVVQTARLSTQWKDVWQKALLAMVEDPSLEDIDITLTNFLEQFSEFNRPRQHRGFKFNFGGGRFFLVAITSNNTLVFDFSSLGEQKLSKPFDLLLSLNLPTPYYKQPSPEHIKVKSLHLKSVNSLVCEALSSFLSKKKLPFLKSLTIEKCNELQALEINKAKGLKTLIVLDCPKLESLSFNHSLYLECFRYRGRYVPFYYLSVVIRDVMLDFRQGLVYNHKENCENLGLLTFNVRNSCSLTICRWFFESIYNNHYWISSSSRGYICQVDPNCYPDSCKLTDRFSRRFTNENGKCSHATKQTLSHLKLVKLEGFPNEKEEIKFVRKLIPLYEETPEIIAKSPDGTCLRQLILANPNAAAAPISITSTTNLPVKLTSSNYTSWKAQMDALLVGLYLAGYVDGSFPLPPFEIQQEGEMIPNPAYNLWLRQDKLILHALITSTSESILPYIASATTSSEAWNTLAKVFANKNRSRIMSLKEQLSLTRRDQMAVGDYIQHMKQLADAIRMAGSPVEDDDLVLHILKGVGPDFKDVVAAVRCRETPMSIDELHSTFTAHELHLKNEAAVASMEVNIPSANFTRRVNNNNSNHGRGRFNSRFNGPRTYSNHSTVSNNNNRPTCQICDKFGHSVRAT